MKQIFNLCTVNKNNRLMKIKELEPQKAKWMEQTNYDLIKGEFTPDEALEILVYLFDKKINFHQLKSFSSEIRFGDEDQKSVKRYKELKLSKASMVEFMQSAKEQGRKLKINSNVTIEIL